MDTQILADQSQPIDVDQYQFSKFLRNRKVLSDLQLSTLINFKELPEWHLCDAQVFSHILGVTVQTLNNYIAKGVIPAPKLILGNKRRWSVGQIKSALKKV